VVQIKQSINNIHLELCAERELPLLNIVRTLIEVQCHKKTTLTTPKVRQSNCTETLLMSLSKDVGNLHSFSFLFPLRIERQRVVNSAIVQLFTGTWKGTKIQSGCAHRYTQLKAIQLYIRAQKSTTSQVTSSQLLPPTVQIPFYIRSAMCLGTTVTCRSCNREAILFYPGGRCGEMKPFPAWHRIRGHTRRVRRCPDCIRIHEDSFSDDLEERNARFRRVYRRMKTFNRYCRGEQANPLPVEEFIRDQDHPLIIDGDSRLGQNERTMDESTQHMLRGDSLTFRQHFSIQPGGMPNQVPFVQEAVSVHNSTEIDYWREYQAGRRLHPSNSFAAVEEFEVFRAEAQLHLEDTVLAHIVEHMEQCIVRQERVEATGEVNNADSLYVYGIIRDSFDTHMLQYRSPEWHEEIPAVVEYEPLPDYEEAADYYREHEEPEVSFYEWTIRNYEEDETHNVGFPTENALDEDLNRYEWYLRHYGAELQLNDFRLRRAEIANRYYDFNSEKINHVSFQQWLVDYNLQREVRGQTQVTSTIKALELYWDDVLRDECDELQAEFHRSRTRWFEECRREFYGHARDEYSPLIERLRGFRAECEQIADWNNEHYPNLASVRENLGRICSVFTTRIAMEREPTDEQWQRILEMEREAVREMEEAMRCGPATRDVNWNQLFAQLSEGWEVQDNSDIGDMDESEAEEERTPRLRSRFLQQAPLAEFDDYSEDEETESWQDFSHGAAAPEWC
jgi:tetratricopeptide (TPR) repeat protein